MYKCIYNCFGFSTQDSDTMATDSEEFKEILHCPICMELFEDPHILKCLHTLCITCLNQLKKGGESVKCPTCREVSTSSDIKKDFKMQSLLDIFEKANQKQESAEQEAKQEKAFQDQTQQVQDCEFCKKDSVNSICLTCWKLLCENCAESHKAIPDLAHHKVMPIENIAWEKRAKLQTILAEMSHYKSIADKEANKFQALRSASLLKKQTVWKEIYNAEENAKQMVEKHFNSVRHMVETKSLYYILKVGIILRDLSHVQGMFKAYDTEITEVIDDNDYMKIIKGTDKACIQISQHINRVKEGIKGLQFAPELTTPDFILCPQSLTIDAASLRQDLPQTLQVETNFQSLVLDKRPKKIKRAVKVRVRAPQIQDTSALREQQKELLVPIVPETTVNDTVPEMATTASLTMRSRPSETVSLNIFSEQPMKLERQVTTRSMSDHCFRISCIGNEIWCTHSDRFDIYDTEAVYLRQFTSDTFGNPFDVLETPAGHLIIAGNEGLFLFSKHQEFQSKLDLGRYVSL